MKQKERDSQILFDLVCVQILRDVTSPRQIFIFDLTHVLSIFELLSSTFSCGPVFGPDEHVTGRIAGYQNIGPHEHVTGRNSGLSK